MEYRQLPETAGGPRFCAAEIFADRLQFREFLCRKHPDDVIFKLGAVLDFAGVTSTGP